MCALEEELEFFGFYPSEYHSEIRTKVSTLLGRSISSVSPTSSTAPDVSSKIDKLESSIERNMLIFERYTLRNIFTFPDGFVYERRITDKETLPPGEIKKRVISLCEAKERESVLKERVYQKKVLAAEIEQRLKEAKEIVSLDGISKGVSEINLLVRRVRDLKKMYSWGQQAHPESVKPLEGEIRKRECKDLEKKAPIDILSSIEKALAQQQKM